MTQMPEVRFSVEAASGQPVVTAPEQIDITNAAGLRAAALAAAARGKGRPGRRELTFRRRIDHVEKRTILRHPPGRAPNLNSQLVASV